MAVLLASGTSEAGSAEFALTDGQSATLCLVDADGSEVPSQARALIQYKSAGAQWFTIGELHNRSFDGIATRVNGPGTFRVFRPLAPVAFGVDKD